MVDFTPTEWQEGEEGGTPITADQLNRMEHGIEDDATAATAAQAAAATAQSAASTAQSAAATAQSAATAAQSAASTAESDATTAQSTATAAQSAAATAATAAAAASTAAATAQGAANAAYVKPGGGIPAADLTTGVQAALTAAGAAYVKPGPGIPKTDLTSAVQASLGLADSAYQPPAVVAAGADRFAAQEVLGLPRVIDAGSFPWPQGLVALFDFQRDSAGGNTVTSRVGSQTTTLTARGSKTVTKDAADPGPFGPSLILDGATVFVKDGSIGGLDVSKSNGQVTVITWVKDTANNHDDTGGDGLVLRAGSHVDGSEIPARQYGSYFDANFYLWSKGHYTPHIGAQDGPSPGYPFNHDHAASARKLFTGTGQGQWHMEAMTFDGARLMAYVDGITDQYKAVADPPPSVGGAFSDTTYLSQVVDRNPYMVNKTINASQTTKRFTIGGNVTGPTSQGANMMTGKLGGVAVFSRALSAGEIMQIRVATLLSGEAITLYGFEVAATGVHRLKGIGWSAKGGAANVDVSGLSTGPDYSVNRPTGGTKSYLTKTSTQIGAAWGPVTGLNSGQLARARFQMLSAAATSAAQRLLIQVGGQWWASKTSFTTATPHAADTDWTAQETMTLSVAWDADNWYPVAMTDTPTAIFVNLAQNPALNYFSTNWGVSGAAANATGARTASGAGYVWLLTWAGTDTAAGAGGTLNHPAIQGLTAGQQYSASAVAKCSKAQLLYAQIVFYDTGGSVLATSDGAPVTAQAGTETTLTATGTAPTNAVKCTIKVSPPTSGGTNWVATDTLALSKALVVAGASLPAYFDGDTPGAAWSGTPGSSTSSFATVPTAIWTNLVKNPTLTSVATNWFVSGSVPNAAGARTLVNGKYVWLATWTGTDNGSNPIGGTSFPNVGGLSAGQVYAASMKVNANRSQRLRLEILWYDVSNTLISTTSGATVTAGKNTDKILVAAGTAPAGATQASIRVYMNGGRSWLSGDTLAMSEAVMVAGSLLPDYFDGASVGGAWTGTAWASASIITGAPQGELSIGGATNTALIANAPLTAIGFLSSGGDGSAVRVTGLELLTS